LEQITNSMGWVQANLLNIGYVVILEHAAFNLRHNRQP